ncbi:HORMA domain-containing protein 1 [Trichonephila clavata]|uniref:HORMA domain-containing protein 1 n=1 Tax=Trichonephila clavata TaxID=2740835 RepID=A0A8X6H4R4_TRICU|nr:HORMA domain-containing protein 1 [Trichonephila clavata]
MSSVMMKPDVTMQEWNAMFPDFTTIEGSCLFIKKLIAVSLSAITYIRGIFPEKAYGERNLYGLRLKLLTEDSGMKSVTKFIDLIRGCYDAVEKKYLQQLSIGICQNKENRNEVIEAYNLVFSYKNEECSITCQSRTNTFSPKLTDPTVEASLLMLKNITAINDILGEMPKTAYLSLKLLYYDNVTPTDYEPPGFEPSTQPKFSFPVKTMNIALGKIDTEVHGYKFLLKTTLNKQLLLQNTSEDPLLLPASQNSTNAEEVAHDDISKEELFGSQKSTQESLNNAKLFENIKTIPSLRCPCKSKMARDEDIIICVSCERLQHKVCYGILEPEDIPEVFYCVECIIYNTDGNLFSDTVYAYQGKERQPSSAGSVSSSLAFWFQKRYLLNWFVVIRFEYGGQAILALIIKEWYRIKKKEFCATRRALVWCLKLKTIRASVLEKILGYNETMANIVIEKLDFEGFIKQISGTENYLVERFNISSYGLQNYFHKANDKMTEKNNLKLESNQESSFVSGSQPQSLKLPSNYAPEISNLESSIKKVKTLSLSNKSPEQRNIPNGQKRKVSSKVLSNDESDESLPTVKRLRTKKRQH